jgi:hypothetical protein
LVTCASFCGSAGFLIRGENVNFRRNGLPNLRVTSGGNDSLCSGISHSVYVLI